MPSKTEPKKLVKKATIGDSRKGQEDVKQRIRIKIKSYDHQVIDTVMRHGADIHGPVPLPTEISKYTVNRSTFVHKDAREQFETRVHKRLIDIYNPSSQLIDALMDLNLPAGIDIEVKM